MVKHASPMKSHFQLVISDKGAGRRNLKILLGSTNFIHGETEANISTKLKSKEDSRDMSLLLSFIFSLQQN
jgi:hypothetical protein